MGNRVVHFEIQADNTGRAMNFYEKVLGWKFKQVMTKEQSGMMDYWLITTGEKGEMGINGGMYRRPAEAADKQYLYDCTVAIPDIDQAVAAVKANGGKITREKEELKDVGWFASATDPEGNHFHLMQPSGNMSEM